MISPKALATRSTRSGVASKTRSGGSRRATSWSAFFRRRFFQNPHSLASTSNTPTSAGSNQRPLRTDATSSAPAVGAERDLDRQGEAADPGEGRDRLALQAVGVALAVPVLVQGAYRPRRLLREAHEARDLRPPLAEDLEKFRDALRPLMVNSYVRPALSSNDPPGLAARAVYGAASEKLVQSAVFTFFVSMPSASKRDDILEALLEHPASFSKKA
jgi:hypothetical protein